jgi:urease accessory protein UreE
MWCERVIRNCDGLPAGCWGGRTVDWVDIEWNECGRLLKKQTRSGEPVNVVLPPGQMLRHHDIIYEEAEKAIAINVLPCEVIVAPVLDWREMAMLALELGNLHVAVQLDYMEIAFIENEAALLLMSAMQIPWVRHVRRFQPVQILSAPPTEVALELTLHSPAETGSTVEATT